jgi:hypothetical protein
LLDLKQVPRERRLQVAQEYVAEEQLASLRAGAKRAFPALGDVDLAGLGLAWQQTKLADGDHVMVAVTFRPQQKGIDAAAVADYVAREVQKDLLSTVEQVEKVTVEQVERMTIRNGWGGLGCVHAVEYTFRRTPQGFEGSATISVDGRRSREKLSRTVSGVVIPTALAEHLLQELVAVPLRDAPYVPRVPGLDDYPSRRIVLDTPTRQVTYFSESQGEDGNPWALEVPGKVYVIPSGSPGRAIEGASAALKATEVKETLDAMCRLAWSAPRDD